MIVMEWAGKAVSKNRTKGPGRGRLVNTDEYTTLKNSLILVWLEQIRRNKFIEAQLPFSRFSLALKVSVGPRVDPQNVIDAVFDSLEGAAVVANDRSLDSFFMFPATVHEQGKQDRIIVMVDGRKG